MSNVLVTEENQTEETTEAPSAEGQEATTNASAIAQNLQRLMEREASVRKQEDSLKELERLRTLEQQLRTEPEAVLRSAGFDFSKLNPPPAPDPQDEMRSQLSELQQKLREREQREAEAARQSEWGKVENQVIEWASSQDKFPGVKAAEAGGLVWQRMLHTLNTTGELPNENQVAEAVEAELQDLAKKLAPLVKNDEQDDEVTDDLHQSRTLSNSHSATPSSRTEPDWSQHGSRHARIRAFLEQIE